MRDQGLKEFSEQVLNGFGLTAKKKSNEDYMGFSWFEIFKHGESTGESFNAIDEAHAIKMYNLS